MRRGRDSFRVGKQCRRLGIEVNAAPLPHEGTNEFVRIRTIGDLSPEVVRVSLDSVMTFVCEADHRRKHLARRAGQR